MIDSDFSFCLKMRALEKWCITKVAHCIMFPRSTFVKESTKTPGIHEHRGKLSGLKLLPFAEGSENLASIYLENVS